MFGCTDGLHAAGTAGIPHRRCCGSQQTPYSAVKRSGREYSSRKLHCSFLPSKVRAHFAGCVGHSTAFRARIGDMGSSRAKAKANGSNSRAKPKADARTRGRTEHDEPEEQLQQQQEQGAVEQLDMADPLDIGRLEDPDPAEAPRHDCILLLRDGRELPVHSLLLRIASPVLRIALSGAGRQRDALGRRKLSLPEDSLESWQALWRCLSPDVQDPCSSIKSMDAVRFSPYRSCRGVLVPGLREQCRGRGRCTQLTLTPRAPTAGDSVEALGRQQQQRSIRILLIVSSLESLYPALNPHTAQAAGAPSPQVTPALNTHATRSALVTSVWHYAVLSPQLRRHPRSPATSAPEKLRVASPQVPPYNPSLTHPQPKQLVPVADLLSLAHKYGVERAQAVAQDLGLAAARQMAARGLLGRRRLGRPDWGPLCELLLYMDRLQVGWGPGCGVGCAGCVGLCRVWGGVWVGGRVL